MSDDEGLRLITSLHRARYIRRNPKKPDQFQRTVKGQRLAMSYARGIRRETANRMLADLLHRAEQINNDSQYCYRVKYLILFGSYVSTDKAILGDLDVGFVLENRYLTRTKQSLAEQERCRSAKRNFASEADRRLWPYQEVCLALKDRTSNLSLHDMHCDGDEEVILGGPHKILKVS